MMENVAYRGFSAVTPENTLTAFHRARQAGCHRVSSELRLSLDGRVFCFADPSLHRVTGSHGWFHRMSSFELRLRPIPFAGQLSRHERILPLEDLLGFAGDTDLGLQLSLPVGSSPRWRGIVESTAESVLEALAPWQGSLDLQLCAGDRGILSCLLKRSPWPVGGLPTRFAEGMSFLEMPNLAFLRIGREMFIPPRRRKRGSPLLRGGLGLIDACRARKVKTYLGPVEKRAEIDLLSALGPDGILSPRTAQLASMGLRKGS